MIDGGILPVAIGIGVGVVTIFGTGFAFGKNRNGFVKQSHCNTQMQSFTDKQGAIHEKINVVGKDVAFIKGKMSKNKKT